MVTCKSKIDPKLRPIVVALSYDELHSIHHFVFERLKMMRKADDLLAMKDLQLFDRVYFDHEGVIIYGYVHRLNQKMVSVHDDVYRIWKVSPQLLHKDAGPTSDILKKLLADNTKKSETRYLRLFFRQNH